MKEALREAQKSYELNEVPVGCVVVHQGKIISRAHNLIQTKRDPTAHAELLAIQEASKWLKNERMAYARIYTTLEPCIMCTGAMILARVEHLIYGASDPKCGAANSLYNIPQDKRLNHQIIITAGVLEKECRKIIQDFFKTLRKKN